ncbi:MAG: hypothetical protein ABIF11_01785 [Nitrospirota bacterium]
MSDSLEVLQKHKDFILLSELLALLHDIGKYYEGIKIKFGKPPAYRPMKPPVYHNTIGGLLLNVKALKGKLLKDGDKVLKSKGQGYAPIDMSTLPFQLKSDAFNIQVSELKNILPNWWCIDDFLNVTLGEFLLTHHAPYRYGELGATTVPEKILSKADSLDSAEDREGAMDKRNRLKRVAKLHTPFGIIEEIEYRFSDEETILNCIASKIEKGMYADCYDLSRKLKEVWCSRPADTRAPFNDTTLWNHSYMVASIFKATVGATILQNTLIPENKIRENLAILSIQSPNRDFLTNVYRLPDYNGRKAVLDRIRDEIKRLVEFEYPLGNCVYEDINGQYFLVPQLEDGIYQEIQGKITKIYNQETRGIMLPRIQKSPCEIKPQSSLLQIGKTIIERKKEYDTDVQGMVPPYHFEEGFKEPNWVAEWENANNNEVCQVCYKMPAKDEEHIFYHDKICQWCGERRKDIAIEKTKEAKFINEVMDRDRRYALLVGEVGLLDQWLNGDYIKTTFVNKERNLPKPASPSRMMRIWEEIDGFDKVEFEKIREERKIPRLKLRVTYDDSEGKKRDKIYKHKLEKKDIEVVVRGFLLSKGIVNKEEINGKINKVIQELTYNGSLTDLELLVKGNTVETITAYRDISLDGTSIPLTKIIKEYLLPGRTFEFKDDRGEILDINFTRIEDYNEEGFEDSRKEVSAVKTIYSYSGEFMYLLPADQAIKIANRLREQFNDRYYKVQGRLCLNLGLVYADHKYPLYMVLDAGKRMLKEFKVANGLEKGYDIEGTDVKAYGIVSQWAIDDGNRKLEIREEIFDREEQRLTAMDKITTLQIANGKESLDQFYPYFLKVGDESNKIEVVHINDISNGDNIVFAPGVFDFEWLDSSKRRVNLTLKKKDNGEWRKRDNIFPLIYTRPYRIQKLEDILELGRIVKTLKITTTALEKFRENLSGEIYRWFHDKEDFPTDKDRDQVEKLAYAMIQNMEGFKGKDPKFVGKFKQVSRNLEVFDLLELGLFLKSLDWQEVRG